MSPGAGRHQEGAKTIVKCRRCDEWLWATRSVAYAKRRIVCPRCGGPMRPTSAGGQF